MSQATAPHAPPAETTADEMPLNGIDHVEFYVGNAAQAAYFYEHAFGFRRVAYTGLETGLRDRVSHVLEQGRIRLVFTGALGSDSEIARHHARPRRRRSHDRAVGPRRRPRARRGGAPRREERRGPERRRATTTARSAGRASRPTATPSTPSSTAPDTTGRSCPASRPAARTTPPAMRCSSASTTSSATSSSATWRSGSSSTRTCSGWSR